MILKRKKNSLNVNILRNSYENITNNSKKVKRTYENTFALIVSSPFVALAIKVPSRGYTASDIPYFALITEFKI